MPPVRWPHRPGRLWLTVRQSRFVPGWPACSTKACSRSFAAAASARDPVASRARSLLFDQPRSLQPPGGVVGREHGAEPVLGPVRECVPGPEEQSPAGPDRVDGASAPGKAPIRGLTDPKRYTDSTATVTREHGPGQSGLGPVAFDVSVRGLRNRVACEVRIPLGLWGPGVAVRTRSKRLGKKCRVRCWPGSDGSSGPSPEGAW
jgi:hypothetical protein